MLGPAGNAAGGLIETSAGTLGSKFGNNAAESNAAQRYKLNDLLSEWNAEHIPGHDRPIARYVPLVNGASAFNFIRSGLFSVLPAIHAGRKIYGGWRPGPVFAASIGVFTACFSRMANPWKMGFRLSSVLVLTSEVAGIATVVIIWHAYWGG